jgi:glycosyltransferase involved in cell wall biosynthesis
MNILWYPQLSVMNDDGDYLLTADSNFRVMTDIVAGLRKVQPNIKIDCMLPSNIADRKSLKDVELDSTYEYTASTSVFGTRFHFDENQVRRILENTKYDVIFNNEPCLAMNFRIAGMGLKTEPILATYNHWTDLKRSPKLPKYTYNIRQAESAIFSDLLLGNTNYSLDMWTFNAMADYMKAKESVPVQQKRLVCPPPYNPDAFKGISTKKHSTFTIAYNQRLAGLPYYKYSYENAISIVRELNKEGFDINLKFFNPANKNLEGRVPDETFIKVVDGADKQTYFEELAKCHMTFDYYKDERIWSIGMVEAAALDCTPVLQHFTGYIEMFPDSYDGFFPYQNKLKLKDKIRTLCRDTEYCAELGREAKAHMLENYSAEVVAKNFLKRVAECKK